MLRKIITQETSFPQNIISGFLLLLVQEMRQVYINKNFYL
jgi:hypothetical protein